MSATMMTPREAALTAYFYTVATDERVRAAGMSPTKFAQAFFACIEEDLPSVMLKVLGDGVARAEGPARGIARMVFGQALGGGGPGAGVLSSEAQGALGGAVEALVSDVFQGIGKAIESKVQKRRSR